jgi:hypothetical protein
VSTDEEWSWPDELDALVAAGETHSLSFENDEVRVLSTTIRPGETTRVHTHRWRSVIHILEAGHIVRRDADGNLLADSRDAGPPMPAGTTISLGPLPPHTVENVDESDVRFVSFELKN